MHAALAATLGLAAAGVHASGGQLLATGGATQVEGAAGGGLVPWAVIAGYATEDEIGGTLFASHVNIDDYTLTTGGLAVGFHNRLELSAARQRFALGGTGLTLRLAVLGAKVRLLGDVVYGRLPQLSAGLQYKQNLDPTLPLAAGARHTDGVDAYLSATRLVLDGPFHRNLLLNATVRATRANQLGLLGFGGDRDGGYELVFEGAAAMFLTRRTAIGIEYRQKPDNLSFAGEDDWMDAFIAHFPNKHVALVGGWVDLGSIAGKDDQRGPYLSLQLSF